MLAVAGNDFLKTLEGKELNIVIEKIPINIDMTFIANIGHPCESK